MILLDFIFIFVFIFLIYFLSVLGLCVIASELIKMGYLATQCIEAVIVNPFLLGSMMLLMFEAGSKY